MRRHSWERISQLFKVLSRILKISRLKQMFDVTAQLVNNQDEINGLDKILWGKNSWKRLSLNGDETVINLQRTKVYVFSDSVLCFGKVLQHPDSKRSLARTEILMLSMESRLNSSGTSSQDSQTLQICDKINDLLSDLGQTPETFTGRILFMSMFNDISCDRKGNKDECLANAGVVKSICEKIWYWTMVIHWTRFWKEMVFFRE